MCLQRSVSAARTRRLEAVFARAEMLSSVLRRVAPTVVRFPCRGVHTEAKMKELYSTSIYICIIYIPPLQPGKCQMDFNTVRPSLTHTLCTLGVFRCCEPGSH